MASLDLKFLLVYIRLLPKSTSLIIPVLAMKPWVSLFCCHPWDQVILWNSFQKSYFKSSVKLKTKQLHKKLVLSHSITTDHWGHTGFPRALKCYFEKWKVLTLERKHKKTEKPDPVRISVKRDGRRQPAAWRAEQRDAVCHRVPRWAMGSPSIQSHGGRKGPLASRSVGRRQAHSSLPWRGGQITTCLLMSCGLRTFWHL